ncbi:cytoplasmic 60S subunit biogenesis factor ZNF622-like [Periplaneta americana]|uniref:cytoplasmic 60S subunit biogenesis factor ZNF622-like n=1 Tax=Periplaneta americana TaxID=6978 RepID=UPI0037E8E0E8
MASTYTCITCRVAFKDAEIQRQHYKTDWHRYNLKRKVAELPPVTAEEFQRRVLIQREQDDENNKDNSQYCKVCRKNFSTKNAFENHLNSRKHKVGILENTNDSNIDLGEDSQTTKSIDPSESSVGRDSTTSMNSDTEDSDVEEVDSDEWEDEENPILNNNCLFCSHHSANMFKNLKHMSLEHSFFVPDAEYVVDMKGLLTYLGEKVSQGFMCLWCNDRGKTFYSVQAAQQHMQDKGHCKMLHEGEALAEYSDFYDYSSSYPDHREHTEDVEEEVSVPMLDDSDFQLVLPSGATVGHRSLMRYYRQRFDPNKSVVPQRKKIHKVLAHYRALGWTETQKESAVRKARDIDYMKRVQSKFATNIGVKANKLQKHFRPQVNF